jgi:hypothetical protein
MRKGKNRAAEAARYSLSLALTILDKKYCKYDHGTLAQNTTFPIMRCGGDDRQGAEAVCLFAYLSPCLSSCLLRPSNDTQDVFLLSGDTEIFRGQGKFTFKTHCFRIEWQKNYLALFKNSI